MRRLSIVSRSIRCVQIIEGIDLKIAVEDAPRLERLIIWASSARDGLHRSVKIGHAPELSLLGYLEPKWHVLEVGNTVIKVLSQVSICSIRQCYVHVNACLTKLDALQAAILVCSKH